METLQLGNTEVTDKGLSGLKELTRLKLLRLSSSRATKQGIEDLKRSLPNAEIDVRVKETSDEKRKPQADDGRREP
jgi:selenocysteine-specific translation elongation factor